MRVVVQRVKRAQVCVGGKVVGEIGKGLVCLVAVGKEDQEADADYLAAKIPHLRIFEDDDGRFNRSLLDIGGGILVVSQFTLYGDCRRGRRPSFTDAAEPRRARELYQRFVTTLQKQDISVATGEFQARMAVELVNDGPVTLLLESPCRHIKGATLTDF